MRARATRLSAVRHGGKRLTARDKAITTIRAAGRSDPIFGRATDAGFHFRDRAMTQPWVPGVDLEQQILASLPLSAVPSGVKPWTLGPDLLAGAGSFDSASGWAASGGSSLWSISGGKASKTAGDTASLIRTVAGLQDGKFYTVTLYGVETSASVFDVRVGNTSVASQSFTRGTLTQTVYKTPGSNSEFSIRCGSTTAGSIEGVTVQEVIYDWSWLGANLVTNGDFSSGTTGWSAGGSAVLSVVSGRMRVENGGAVTGSATQTINTTAGKAYRWTFYVDPATSGGAVIRVRDGGTLTVISTATYTVAGNYTVVFAATSSTIQINCINGAAVLGAYHDFDNIVVQEIPGYPMVAPTAGGVRPTGRVNEMQRTEDLAHVAWAKTRLAAVVNNTLVATAVSDTHFVQQGVMTSGLSYDWYVEAQDSGARYVALAQAATLTRSLIVDLQTGTATYTGSAISNVSISSRAGGGWVIRARYVAQTTAGLTIGPSAPSSLTVLGDGVVGVQVHKVDVRLSIYTGSAYPSYQRVNDGSPGVFDYDATGPVWIGAAATNAGLHSVGTVDMTGTDAVRMGAVLVKTSDAASAMVCEMSPNLGSNNGTIYLAAPSAATITNYRAVSKGTVPVIADVSSAAPDIAAISVYAKISADVLSVSKNSAAPVLSYADQGAGNYGAHQYNAWVRSAASGPSLSFPGRMATVAPHLVDANTIDAATFEALIREDAAAVGLTY